MSGLVDVGGAQTPLAQEMWSSLSGTHLTDYMYQHKGSRRRDRRQMHDHQTHDDHGGLNQTYIYLVPR